MKAPTRDRDKFGCIMNKETRIGFYTYFEKIIFIASILFKTTTRVIILNILTT